MPLRKNLQGSEYQLSASFMDHLWDTVYQVANSVGSPIARSREDHAGSTRQPARTGHKATNKTATSPDLIDSTSCESSLTTNTQSLPKAYTSSIESLNIDNKKPDSSRFEDFPAGVPLEHNILSSTNLLSQHPTDRRARSTSSFLDELLGNAQRRAKPSKRENQIYKNRRSWSSTSLSAYKRMGALTKGNAFGISNPDIAEEEKTEGDVEQTSGDELDEAKNASSQEKSTTYTQQFADKFMERLLDMAIPTTAGVEDEKELSGLLSRIEMQKSRPPLTVQTMSKNSIALLQRLSLPFVLIDQIILIFLWKDPIYTVCFLLAATLLILNPSTLLAIPSLMLCYFTILPAFGKRHPVDQKTGEFSKGPMISNIKYPKPVPEISREFLLNVTDLQNHMMIYVIPWDWLNRIIVKYCYFKDERFTTVVFIVSLIISLIISTFGSSFMGFILPVVKFMSVVFLWIFAIVLIPSNRKMMLEHMCSEDTRLRFVTLMNSLDDRFKNEFTWHQKREIRELEIFELQKFEKETKTWQPVCFSPEIYPINSHLRLENLPIDGCNDISYVKPPKGWSFINEASDQYTIRKTKNASTSSLSNGKVRKVTSDLSLSTGNSFTKDDLSDSSGSGLPFSAIKGIKGWYLDLVAINWARENYVDEVLTIDDDTKWCYDDMKYTKKDISKYRRRRWIRYCTRSVRVDEQHDDSVIVED